jgi:acyl-CoA synthetase (AMP-forming)/AMP-acid ligase II/aryl carrier-like protein
MPPCNLVDVLQLRANDAPARVAFTFLSDSGAESNVTYGELDRQARAVAALLQTDGTVGRSAVLVYPPGIEYITAFFGCLYAGVLAVPTPFPSPRRGWGLLNAVIRDAQPAVILTDSDLPAWCSEPERDKLLPHPPVLSTKTLDQASGSSLPGKQSSPDSVAYLQYTSGSTAVPRGVMITHANVLENLRYIDEGFRHDADSVIVSWLPHFHDMGLVYGILQPIFNGCRCVLMPPTSFMRSPVSWLKAISSYGASHSGGPNFAYELCARKIGDLECQDLNLTRWRVAFNGAEVVHASTLNAFAKRFESSGFQRSAFAPAYGLAEATLKVTSVGPKPPGFRSFDASMLRQGGVIALPGDDSAGKAIVSCGEPGSGTTVRIVDPQSLTACAENRIGEIWVNGPGVAAGYWRQPEKTEQVFRARIAGEDGLPFLRTGDLGFLLDGDLFVMGRLKDLIIIRGINYEAEDIEHTAAEAPSPGQLGRVAAFPVQIGVEERLGILVEWNRHVDLEDAHIAIDNIRRAISESHGIQVHTVIVVSKGSIPVSTSGKVQRYLCRQQIQEFRRNALICWSIDEDELKTRHLESIRTMAPAERQIAARTLVLERTAKVLGLKTTELSEETPLKYYGLDSLAGFELLSSLHEDGGLAIDLWDQLESVTIKSLTQAVISAVERKSDPEFSSIRALAPANGNGVRPLSFEQERLWFMDQIDPGTSAYNVSCSIRISGPFSLRKLSDVLAKITACHEILRTSFALKNGLPEAQVATAVALPIKVHEAYGLSLGEQSALLSKLFEKQNQRGFQLSAPPLFRCMLVCLADEDHVLLVTMHHIIADAWSLDVFRDELATFYGNNLQDCQPPKLQFRDFVSWSRRRVENLAANGHVTYWREALAKSEPLWITRMPPNTNSRVERTFAIGSQLTQLLRCNSRREGIRTHSVLLATLQINLHLLFEKQNFIIASPTHGRTIPGARRMIGFFAFPLLLRAQIDRSLTIRDFWGRVQRDVTAAHRYSELPVAQVVRAAGWKRRNGRPLPLQTIFTLLREAPAVNATAETRFGPAQILTLPTDFELSVAIVERGGELDGRISAQSGLLSSDAIDRLFANYVSLLEASIEKPELHVEELCNRG